jgi:hypothetical protein
MKNPETSLDRFRIEEAKINEDVAESEKHYSRVIREQEKIRDAAKVEREKAAAALALLIADFEKIDAELEAEETRRLDAAGLTKAALNEGRISAAEFFKHGLTAGEITAKAQGAASEKLTDLRNMIRAKAVKLLELEEKEFRAEWEIWCASTFPAATLRERLAALLKALEASLSSGIGGGPLIKTKLDMKVHELRNATKGRISGDGEGWQDFDLAGLKRLRLNPTWPADQLQKLEEIIAEAKTTGRACRLMLDVRDKRNVVRVMWS